MIKALKTLRMCAQWCLILCDLVDCSLSGSSVHEISQVSILLSQESFPKQGWNLRLLRQQAGYLPLVSAGKTLENLREW